MADEVSTSPKTKRNAVSILKNKKRRRKTINLDIGGEKIKLTFQAISSAALDKLQSQHPPTAAQRAAGNANFNRETFPPALISACSINPEISVEDAEEIWNSEDWSTGELNFLFDTVISLCMEGLDIAFTGSDFDTTQLSS